MSERRGVILLYHRIADVEPDPWALAVAPQRFAEHLQVIRESGTVLPLDELCEMVAGKGVPERGLAVTFDDGYLDNLKTAAPLLEQHAIPATFFITSGALGSPREYWWDELDRLALRTTTLPPELTLKTGQHAHRWMLGDATEYPLTSQRAHRAWKAWNQGAPSPRHQLFLDLYDLLYPLSSSEREPILDTLLVWAQQPALADGDRCVLEENELLALAANDLFEIGAHTVTHPLLVQSTPQVQLSEISGSKRALEGLLGRPVNSFAYPFGKRGDYTDETVQSVRHCGFTHACINGGGALQPSVDVLQLPRLFVMDWDGDEFARQLRSLWECAAL